MSNEDFSTQDDIDLNWRAIDTLERDDREESSLAQSVPDTSVSSSSQTTRGAPVPGRYELRQQLRRAGEDRIRVLTDVFGQDALVLGHLIFRIPPTAIRITKDNITYRWKPLRTKESIAVKSGNAECFIEISLAFVGIQQISESFAGLIALFKKIPFCPVENAFIRSQMVPDRPDENMALQLVNLIAETVPGQTNSVYVTLVTKWFNYKPYSEHFWFRHTWEVPGANNNPINTPATGSEGNTQGNQQNVPLREPTSIVDLSIITSPQAMSSSLPPEARLNLPSPTTNPGDNTIAPTFPVTYAFNSEPFLRYVRTEQDAAVRVNTWTDNLKMKWNSYVRRTPPRSWQENMRTERVAVANAPSEDRSDVPPPVTGDRDVILWMGDSIMVGFTGSTTRPGTAAGQTLEVLLWNNTRLDRDAVAGFTNYIIAQVGINSRELRSAWNRFKSDSRFKRSTDCDRVAGLVLHVGTNDGVTSASDVTAFGQSVSLIVNEAANLGITVVICSLPPLGDSPPNSSQYAGVGQAQLDAVAAELERVASQYDRATYLDTRPCCADQSRLQEGYNIPYDSRYKQITDGLVNLHPNALGYNSMGEWISRHLPWSSLRGQPEELANANRWRVCEVTDGDTIVVCNSQELKHVRMLYIDSMETYHTFSDSGPWLAEELNEWLPEGQDSWRPADKQFGRLAKERLQSLIGSGSESFVEVEFRGTDTYGRDLGVVSKGEVNINLELVRSGLVYLNDGDLPAEERGAYEGAAVEAGAPAEGYNLSQDSGRGATGLYDNRTASLTNLAPVDLPDEIREHLEVPMQPDSWRQSYQIGSSGSDPTTNCCED